MKYYHITTPENAVEIMFNGIKANSKGQIFLFEDVSFIHPLFNKRVNISDLIASNQLFLNKYCMFEIDSDGFNYNLKPDKVAEIGSQFQWVLNQKRINKKYIKFVGTFNTVLPGL